MFSLPLLVAEDISSMDTVLREFITASGARLALFTDPGGFIVTREGDLGDLDIATLGALAANSFAATQAIAGIIEDQSVTSLYQEGALNSLLIFSVTGFGFLVVVFPAAIGVGVVKFFAEETLRLLDRRLTAASERAPAEGLDLSALNVADAMPLFCRRSAP